jgi:hypothetical protein
MGSAPQVLAHRHIQPSWLIRSGVDLDPVCPHRSADDLIRCF